jgi:Protein of unknown function (DUF3618)
MVEVEPARGRRAPAGGADAGLEDVQADIEQTRQELGATVDAISGKLNVVDKARSAAPRPATVAFLGGVAVVGVVWWRLRRSRRRR